MEENKFSFPTEIVELPSKGLIYPPSSPLSSGKVEMKYMTAKEEDILTNQAYIQKGIVLDKLLQSLIVTKIDYNELIAGDKNAIMIAARVLGYGKDYSFNYNGVDYEIDLTQIDNKPFNESLITKGINEFSFVLPTSSTPITYKLLNHGDEEKLKIELESYKKINKNISPELSTRLKYMITSINGERDPKMIREFVDVYLLAKDSRALRNHIKETQPDIDLTFFPDGNTDKVDIPIGVKFFWPDF